MSISITTAARGTSVLLRKIRSKGVRNTCRAVADRVEEWILAPYYEWRLGITTSGRISSEALGYQHPECNHYGPSAYGNIRRIFKALNVQHGKDVFVDFGSGKGRVLILAAMQPFERIIGVERSPDLSDIARHNIERTRRRMTCQHIEVVTADAVAYEVPDDATVVYFANPFGGEILDAVLDNVKASLMRAPRQLSVISHGYDSANPFERQIRMCEWLYLREEVRLQRINCAWIYTNSRWNARAIGPAA